MEDNILILEDDKGNPCEFMVIDVYEFEGATYFAMVEVIEGSISEGFGQFELGQVQVCHCLPCPYPVLSLPYRHLTIKAVVAHQGCFRHVSEQVEKSSRDCEHLPTADASAFNPPC